MFFKQGIKPTKSASVLHSNWTIKTPSEYYYLQVNAVSEWIIGIYLHVFTNNELEISIPHKAAECGIETFEFIVSEGVQVNPDNSRAISVQIEYTANKNRQTSSHSKPWCNYSGVWNLHHGYYTTTMESRSLFRHNPVSRGTNKPIRKSVFAQL